MSTDGAQLDLDGFKHAVSTSECFNKEFNAIVGLECATKILPPSYVAAQRDMHNVEELWRAYQQENPSHIATGQHLIAMFYHLKMVERYHTMVVHMIRGAFKDALSRANLDELPTAARIPACAWWLCRSRRDGDLAMYLENIALDLGRALHHLDCAEVLQDTISTNEYTNLLDGHTPYFRTHHELLDTMMPALAALFSTRGTALDFLRGRPRSNHIRRIARSARQSATAMQNFHMQNKSNCFQDVRYMLMKLAQLICDCMVGDLGLNLFLTDAKHCCSDVYQATNDDTWLQLMTKSEGLGYVFIMYARGLLHFFG